MKGITFGDVHSYHDLRLILGKKEIGSPPVKERKTDIEGADGYLDHTEFFGEAKFENAVHKFEFSTTVPQEEFLSQYSMVKNALHGKKVRVILDDDPNFYYIGRLKVSPFNSEKAVGSLSVEADCEPYKYNLEKTIVQKAINGSATITLMNGRKRVVPEIATTTPMTISFGGGSWSAGAGTFRIPELELVQGENVVGVTGTGTITFTYQEGNL